MKSRLSNPHFFISANLNRTNNFFSDSSAKQAATEVAVEKAFLDFMDPLNRTDASGPLLLRDKHSSFLFKGLFNLPSSFESLDSSQPWLVYWILNSLTLLDEAVSDEVSDSIIEFLRLCQDVSGGFGGGPGQLPHLAATYAAINSLALLNRPCAYEIIDRNALKNWLMRLRQPDGSFALHVDGEVDVRAVYCALSSCALLNLITPELFEGTLQWILSCQTFEGGFGACLGAEAHGGYTFCGLASLAILGKLKLCDYDRALRWIACRQMPFEGGFQGRTNKQVDSCYSFWQGASFAILDSLFERPLTSKRTGWIFDQVALQEYVLIVCQSKSGGIIDKPGKRTDFYHTCYALSGISISQHDKDETNILGPAENEVAQTHPLHNVSIVAVRNMREFFYWKDNEQQKTPNEL